MWQQLVTGEHDAWHLNFGATLALSVMLGIVSYYGVERLFASQKSARKEIAYQPVP